MVMAGKIRKATGIFLLILAIIISQIPPTVVESSEENAFQLNGDTLVKYTGTAEVVSVPSGVKTIAEEAFANNASMKKVELPSSLENIKFNAFFECVNLEEVSLNNNLISIGSSAFSNCKKLSKIELPASLEKLGSGVFAGCDSLKDVPVASKNNYFTSQDGVIYNKDKSVLYEMVSGYQDTVFRMPDTVKEINQYAFWGCENLQGVTLSNQLKKISAYSFSNCEYLTGVSIPYSVTSIEERAFQDCRNLGEISIPESVYNIHESAFERCFNLSIQAPEGTAAYLYAQNYSYSETDKAEQEDSNNTEVVTTSSADSADTETVNSEDVTTPTESINTTVEDTGVLLGQTKVASRRAVVFIDNSNQKVYHGETESAGTVLPTEEGENQTSLNPNMDNTEQIMDSANASGEKGIYIPKYAIYQNKIVDFAFYGDQNLEEYTIDQNVTTIGAFSFARTNLYEMKIPNGVEVIEQGAFYHCSQLYQIEIPDSVKKIEKSAFGNTPFFQNWVNQVTDSDFLIVGDGVLIGYKGNSEKVNIPNGVKSIAPEVFMDHDEIKSVILPDTLLTIGEDAFANCKYLSILLGGSFVVSIEDRAFYGTAIESIRISSDVENIGLQAFGSIKNNVSFNGDNTSIVFYGDTIPNVSYQQGATRYSNQNYRNRVFDQVTIALVEDYIKYEDLNLHSVLRDERYGYRGLIGTITKQPMGDSPGNIQVRYDNSDLYTTEENAYPSEIMLYGERYLLEYQNMKVVKPETLESEIGNEMLTIENSTNLFPVEGTIGINGLNQTEAYLLKIQEVPEMDTRLKDAFHFHYSEQTAFDTWITFDMQLYDQAGLVPIQKFGKDRLEITLPISEELAQKNFHFITIDQDGQLEELVYRIEKEQDITCIKFSLNHFSPFAFYVTSEEGAIKRQNSGQQTFLSGQKDQSPNTGDFSVDTKWFFVVGLVSLSLILILYKEKRVKKISDLH